MKEIVFPLDIRSFELFFAPVRCKKDVILLLMKSIKHMIVGNKLTLRNSTATMILRISKMSRLLFVSEDKQFSISFPFRVRTTENVITDIYSSIGVPIDNKITSEIILLLANIGALEFDNLFTIIEALEEIEGPSDGLFSVFMNLMVAEDGYVRCEYDKLREDAAQHPLNHLDIFYENSNTFKLGLTTRLNHNDFIDILDLTTTCRFIN